MTDHPEVNSDNLQSIRQEKGLNQDDIANILGITRTAVSKIENGTRSLSSAEKAILDWHFFGIMPPRLQNPSELRGILEFSEEEWGVIGVLARRVGQTHQQWIKSVVLNLIYGSNLNAAEDPATYPAKHENFATTKIKALENPGKSEEQLKAN